MSMKWKQEDGTDTTIRQMDKGHLISAILWMGRSSAFRRREKDGMYLTEWVHDMSKELRRRELKEKTAKKKTNTRRHITRPSDSSLYDEICTVCGATDAIGNTMLDRPCLGHYDED